MTAHLRPKSRAYARLASETHLRVQPLHKGAFMQQKKERRLAFLFYEIQAATFVFFFANLPMPMAISSIKYAKPVKPTM